MNRIHLVATGGTVGSVERGGTVELDSAERPAILEFLPSGVECTWSRPFSILSEDASSGHWTELARHIRALPLERLDAVLVAHGSDTLAWTAAALSFALRGAPLPVVLFGSDRPLSDPRSNGADNFRSGISFSLSERLPGVFVAWRNPGEPAAIHLGTRLLPADPHLDRFRSPMDAPYGHVSDGVFSRVAHPRNPTRSDLAARSAQTWSQSLPSPGTTSLFEDRVLVLPPQPGMDHTPLLAGLEGWKAILQLAHHSGTAASAGGNGSFLALARAAKAARIPVLLGPTRPGSQYRGRTDLLDAGVRIAPNQTWPSLAVKIRLLLGAGGLDRLDEDLAWELL